MWSGSKKAYWSKVYPYLKHVLSWGHNPKLSTDGLTEEESASNSTDYWLTFS